MAESQIVIYGASWCPDCLRAKRFLSEQLVRFRWVDVDSDLDARSYVERVNQGKRIIPTIVFPDGSILVEPSNAELARKLGIVSKARMSFYDLIIVGGGPAGLTASIYTAREQISTLLIERSTLGGQASVSSRMENFPGFPEGISGQEFAARVVAQARHFGVEILGAQEVKRLDVTDNYRILSLGDGNHYSANAVLLATGATYRRLNVAGEDDFIGAGIHFCATCDAPFYRGAEHLVVVGGGNTAVEEGLFLTQIAQRVTYIVRGNEFTASRFSQDKVLASRAIDVRFNTVITGFQGDGRLKSVSIRNTQTGAREELFPAAVFVLIGSTPNNAVVRDLVRLDESGYVLTGHDLTFALQAQLQGDEPPKYVRVPHAMETSVRGIFAAGDVRAGATKQVASAVGEGASAAIAIRDYLRGR